MLRPGSTCGADRIRQVSRCGRCGDAEQFEPLSTQHLDVHATKNGPWNPQHGDIEIPTGWDFLPSGDAFLTRTVKAAGTYWLSWQPRSQQRQHRRLLGLWAPSQAIAASWFGTAIGRYLLQSEYKLSDVFAQDIGVPHRRTIQARPLQPWVDEPRKRVAMTGTTLAQRNRHRGGQGGRQPGQPATLLFDLGFGPVDAWRRSPKSSPSLKMALSVPESVIRIKRLPAKSGN